MEADSLVILLHSISLLWRQPQFVGGDIDGKIIKEKLGVRKWAY